MDEFHQERDTDQAGKSVTSLCLTTLCPHSSWTISRETLAFADTVKEVSLHLKDIDAITIFTWKAFWKHFFFEQIKSGVESFHDWKGQFWKIPILKKNLVMGKSIKRWKRMSSLSENLRDFWEFYLARKHNPGSVNISRLWANSAHFFEENCNCIIMQNFQNYFS